MQPILEGLDAFNALAFGAMSPESIAYFRREHEALMGEIHNMPVSMYNPILDFAEQQYNRYLSDQATLRIKNTLRQAGLVAGNTTSNVINATDIILPVLDIKEILAANPVTQRYLMACPEIAALYSEDKLDGYADTYVDTFPNTDNFNDEEYIKVVNHQPTLVYPAFQDTKTTFSTNPNTYLTTEEEELEFYDELVPDSPYFASRFKDDFGDEVIKDVMAEFKYNQSLGIVDPIKDPRVPLDIITTHYYFEENLDLEEQTVVQSNWDAIRRCLGHPTRQDPTNPIGGYF